MRAERLGKTRAILNNEKFRAMPDEQQAEILETLVEKGLAREDLAALLAEVYKSFDILDKGVLTQILSNLSPDDVLNTCKTSKRYASICSDQDVFRRLLTVHYPGAFFTDNPRLQYIAITSGVETLYLMKQFTYYEDGVKYTDYKNFDPPILIDKPMRPEDTPGWSLRNLDGYSILDFLRLRIIITLDLSPVMGWIKQSTTEEQYKTLLEAINSLQELHSRISVGYGPQEDIILETIAEVLDPLVKNALKTDRKKTISLFSEHIIKGARDRRYKPEYSNDLVFTIEGLAIPTGTLAWLLIQLKENSQSKAVDVYRTKHEMCRDFVEKNYNLMLEDLINGEDFRHYILDLYNDRTLEEQNEVELEINSMSEEEVLESTYFKGFLENAGVVPIPFTKEGLFQYCMRDEVDEYRLLPNLDALVNFWLFRPVTF